MLDISLRAKNQLCPGLGIWVLTSSDYIGSYGLETLFIVFRRENAEEF